MYGCKSWTIKKDEHRRIYAFEVWCWRRLLRVPWTARRSNQSILQEISPEYWLEGLMLKLKLQYLATWCEEPMHWKRPWCWKRLKAGEGDDREDEMVGGHHRHDGHGFVQAPGVGNGQGNLACCSPRCCKDSDRLSDWIGTRGQLTWCPLHQASRRNTTYYDTGNILLIILLITFISCAQSLQLCLTLWPHGT